MKILMLSQVHAPSIGGGVRYQVAIVEHFRRQGHQVDVLTVNGGPATRVDHEEGGSVWRAPQLLHANSTAVSPAFVRLYGRLAPEYDVLHFNFPSPMAELAMLVHRRRTRDARKVALYHADIVPAKRFSGPYNRFVTRPFLREMDAVVVSSPRLRDSSPHLQPVRARTHVIPFGIDDADFQPRRPVARGGGELEILFVGRLSRYKGLDYLIRAMAGSPGRLSVVGEGPLREPMEALAASVGVADRVRFLGRIADEELVQRYHEADVLVLPSIDAGEAFGYVLIEAMICGSAVISTELGTGTSFINQDGRTGFVVPPRDTAALAAALRRLAEDRGLLRQMQAAARQRVLDDFNLQTMCSRTEQLYAA